MENLENPDSPKEYIHKITEDPAFSSEDPQTGPSSNSLVCQVEKRKNDSSGENSSSPKKIRSNVNYKEEYYFTRLCETAFGCVREVLNLSDTDIEWGIRTIIDSFRYSDGKKFSNIDFSKPENLWAYLLRHGPSSAGFMRQRISDFLENSDDIRNCLFESFSPEKTIKVLNLGSGPGCDIVGLCSSLQKYVSNKRIQFTLVDSFRGWVSVFNIIEFLLREGNYGNACEFFKNNDISTNYLCVDITKDTSENEEFEKSLKEADIIMLNRVISIIDREEDRIHIAQSIGEKMKKGAVLFFADSPYFLERYSSAFLNLKVLTEKNEDIYIFQVPRAMNFFVARETNAQINILSKV